MWRGWLPSVIGVIPYVGLNFAVYETSKDAILSHYGALCARPRHLWSFDLWNNSSLPHHGSVKSCVIMMCHEP